jgi:hypothetical protein
MRQARLGGVLYLVVIATAAFAEPYVRGSMIVGTDAAATAANILKSERLYRLGGAADLVNLCCDVGVAVLLYCLLRSAGQALAMAAAAFRIVADVCLAIATFFHFQPLYLLKDAPYLNVFSQPQLQALALESLKLHSLGYNVSMVFFAVGAFALGLLISRSAILPRPIGWLFLATGVCYLANSFSHLVLPGVHIPVALLLVGFVSESALALWLLVRGVKVPAPAADAMPAAAA